MNRSHYLIIPFIIFSPLFLSGHLFGQNTYSAIVNKAHVLRQSKQLTQALNTYQLAFKTFPDSVTGPDLYYSACAMAFTAKPDSALLTLRLAAIKYKFTSDVNLQYDKAWVGWRQRADWQAILATVVRNKEAAYTPLQREMLSIMHDDQFYRKQIDSITRVEGAQSKKLPGLIRKCITGDSINLITTEAILDKYGWPSPAEVGNTNNGLFAVVQHADLKTQLKYLPMFREAVKTKYFYPPNLAALEDRVAKEQGKNQLYGTQIDYNGQTNTYTIYPIADEANVNLRRAQLGMEPLEIYVKRWGITYQLPVK